MGTANAKPSIAQSPSIDLEELFAYFFVKFEAIPAPRSVAETRITDDELRALSEWLIGPAAKPRDWCEDRRLIHSTAASPASPQEMYGSLLLILASEMCRERSTEDAVWPTVTAVLKQDRTNFSYLFANGQPTASLKNALAAGARRLMLRNLIDRHGAQEYFDTIKLQFGFTRRGGLRRLPDWLDGLGVPIAVKILKDAEGEHRDLISESFGKLWDTLRDYRRDRIVEPFAKGVLRASPWIRQEWVEELLHSAKLRSDRVYQGGQQTHSQPSPLSFEPICEPLLRWDNSSKPSIFLRLNEEKIYEALGQSDVAAFLVDGRVVDRWTALDNGEWRGKREIPCQPGIERPNLRPRVLAIHSRENVIDEISLSDFGLSDPLIIFDFHSGALIDRARTLDRNRSYAILADTDFSVPAAVEEFTSRDRFVCRIADPLPADLEVLCEETLFWQPQTDHSDSPAPLKLTVEAPPGEILELDSESHLLITGVPDDATSLNIMVGFSIYQGIRSRAGWKTDRPVRITLELAEGNERIRIRLAANDRVRTIVPRIALPLRGIAAIQPEASAEEGPRWSVVNGERPLNRAAGQGRVRVWFSGSTPQLYEGYRLVSKTCKRTIPMSDLCGWGDQLVIRSQDDSSVLVTSVEDLGSGKFLPPLFRGSTDARLAWRAPIVPGEGHRIVVWSERLDEPRWYDVSRIRTEREGLIWRIPGLDCANAVSVRQNRCSSSVSRSLHLL